MELAPPVCRAADRLGLAVEQRGDRLELKRHQWRVTLEAPELFGSDAPDSALDPGAWVLMGVRLGLDKRARPDESDPYKAPQFRRASVQRYHEAPSVHGDRLPLLVPRITRQIFDTIAETSAFWSRWQLDDLEIVVINETGTRLEVLTEEEQQDADLSAEKRFTKVRSALFYQSYKVRPTETKDVDGGRLRIIETREGFGASRALLLPEFDYDASREYGYLAVPSRDRIIIARPDEQQTSRQMIPALENLVDDSLRDTDFGMTDAIFQLDPEDVNIFREPTRRLGPQAPPAVELVTDVIPP